MIPGPIAYIFGVIWITMLTLQIGIPGNMGAMNWLDGGVHSLSALVSVCVALIAWPMLFM